jgi:hypothetical protein
MGISSWFLLALPSSWTAWPTALAAWVWKNQFTMGETMQVCGCPRCTVQVHIIHRGLFLSFLFSVFFLPAYLLSLSFLLASNLSFLLPFFLFSLYIFYLLSSDFLNSIPYLLLLSPHMYINYFAFAWVKCSFPHSSFDSQCMQYRRQQKDSVVRTNLHSATLLLFGGDPQSGRLISNHSERAPSHLH